MVIGPLTPLDVEALVAAGEDSFTEFKSGRTSNAALAEELVAFLNADGGRVLLGVEEDGEIAGLGEWEEESVMNIARTLVEPPVIPVWQRVTPNVGPAIAVISVDRGTAKPYAAGGGESRRYFVRVGSTSREASREELIRLTQASGAVQADLRPAIGAAASDLEPSLLAARFAGRRSLDWSALPDAERRRILIDAEILHAQTGGPTVAGLLCFGRDPQQRLGQAHVQCVTYPGALASREIIDQRRFDGRVDEQVREAARFLDFSLARGSTVIGVERRDVPHPTPETLREIVANAVAHRDYAISAPVQLRIFSDRVVVLSPGTLPNGVTPSAMRVGISVRRNPFLVQHLAEQRLVDALGRGIVIAIEEALALGLGEPRIETPGGFVEVTLPTV